VYEIGFVSARATLPLVRSEPLYKTFDVPKIILAATPPPTIGQGLRQMQCSRRRASTFPLLTNWFPVAFQPFPSRSLEFPNTIDRYGIGSTAWASLEYALSIPLESTAVVT
jgi:hypothetical protein